jgi:MYXO-CTERM domain-containing protein
MRLSLARLSTLVVAVGCLVAPTEARAELKQPDGTVIPVTPRLQEVLTAEGESIDPLTQAAATPETFDPACSLVFSVVARASAQRDGFGWYNVTGKKPAPSELYSFLACDDAAGTTRPIAIRDDPRYLGGRIGFFEATPEGKPGDCVTFGPNGPDPATLGYIFYSEKAYNEDNSYHLLILDSGKYKNAFYFAWEDLKTGNDNDFEDLVTRVDGIQCAGAGEPCQTGLKGICGVGVLQCKGGTLTCVAQNAPRAETCNGLDDDCNDAVDDAKECSCSSGEFSCPSNRVCDQGICRDAACVGKTCGADEVCAGGVCKQPCAGILCPAGLVCRLDVCVDACAGVKCEDEQVCDLGVCRTKCQCASCDAGKVCAASGKCVETGCDTVTCSPGTTCQAGQCVDACLGAVCPLGTICEAGACIVDPNGAGGSGIVIGGSGGGGSTGKAGGAGNGGALAAGSAGLAGAGGGAGSGRTPPSYQAVPDDADSGCGCRTTAPRGSGVSLAGLGVVALVWGVRRRR